MAGGFRVAHPLSLVVISFTSLAIYLYLLSKHLRTRHPKARPRGTPTLQEYKAAGSYQSIVPLANAPNKPTHKGYAIIGGSGFVGMYLVRLLLLRGETNIRIIGVEPPPEDIRSHSAVSYIEADITLPASIREALIKPFQSTGQPPNIIYHLAATIRFWERYSYTWEETYRVNVQGTENILKVLQEFPLANHVETLIYISTGDVAIPRVRLWSLGWLNSKYPWNTIRKSDSDRSLTGHEMSEGCYTRSKKMAEDLILAANEKYNFKTGVLRPGYTIIGVNDRLISSTLHLQTVPMFDQHISHTDINVWDLASGMLLLEDALQTRPEEVAGQAFLITGDGEAWTIGDVRRAVKHYSSKPIQLQEVPPLVIFLLSHTIELFLYLRFYLLRLIFLLARRKDRPSLAPSWIGQALILQPATFEYFADVEIDDSRARKLLKYKPQWEMLQTIKNVVDDFESGASKQTYGMDIKKYLN